MSKLMLIPSSKEMFNLNVDAFALGIKDLSVNMPIYYALEDIKEIVKNNRKEIFVVLNKNMHSSDLNKLELVLRELSILNIKGIFYYDIAVYNLSRKLDLNIDLVWAQEHLATNYETINYWYSKGVNYTLLASEICKHEIFEIKDNTSAKLIVPFIGYFPMFVSRRHLVDNYKKRFNLDDNSSIYYIEKEGKIYPIVDEHVTTVYTNSYLNLSCAYDEFVKHNIDYLVINSFLMSDEQIIKILQSNFKNTENILGNTSTFFLNKETIYKVK